MSLFKKIKADQLEARKAKDAVKASLLTTLLGEIQGSVTGGSTPLEYEEDGTLKVADADVSKLIKKFVKSANETIRLKDNPQTHLELQVLESYLPSQLNDDELKALVASYKLIGQNEGKVGGALIGFVMSQMKEGYLDRFDASKVKGLL